MADDYYFYFANLMMTGCGGGVARSPGYSVAVKCTKKSSGLIRVQTV